MTKGSGENDIRKVERTISRYQMLEPGDRVIVAVSGGPDSVCLLDILFRLRDVFGIHLVVAHLNHGLRPDVDAEETRFVASLADALSIPFVTEKTGDIAGHGGGSLEEKARKMRYAFLERVRRKKAAQKIALGHTRDDQAETVLMRLMRGSGSSGLAGIPPVRDQTIIRPLIELTREEVRRYLDARKLKFVFDASNQDTTFLRNHIRLNLIPALKAVQPKVVERIGRTADLMRAEKAYLEDIARRWLADNGDTGKGGDVQFSLDAFGALPVALRRHVVRCALLKAGGTLRRVSLTHIEAIEQMADSPRSQASLSLPNGVLVRRCYPTLSFSTKRTSRPLDFSRRIHGPGRWSVDTLMYTICLEEIKRATLSHIPHSSWTAYLDLALIRYPLVLRNLRPGDRFVPLGMTGQKKVKDFFIDLKIPSKQRKEIPLLVQGDTILWVGGLRIHEGFKVTPQTKTVLKVFFEPSEPVAISVYRP
ncbi:MAG: tRNA lysidine(34) synthetase TilS [Deltaproteobacteria bacterium]|nr:tRNA lysidine(34) synthetase TilS [Deltaproteobacteria bacterium]